MGVHGASGVCTRLYLKMMKNRAGITAFVQPPPPPSHLPTRQKSIKGKDGEDNLVFDLGCLRVTRRVLLVPLISIGGVR